MWGSLFVPSKELPGSINGSGLRVSYRVPQEGIYLYTHIYIYMRISNYQTLNPTVSANGV